jgi:hypothetical protein
VNVGVLAGRFSSLHAQRAEVLQQGDQRLNRQRADDGEQLRSLAGAARPLHRVLDRRPCLDARRLPRRLPARLDFRQPIELGDDAAHGEDPVAALLALVHDDQPGSHGWQRRSPQGTSLSPKPQNTVATIGGTFIRPGS